MGQLKYILFYIAVRKPDQLPNIEIKLDKPCGLSKVLRPTKRCISFNQYYHYFVNF